ncbi:MAG: four helix bundle protein [Candidatus Nomurabacteria bacterium]|nr:four helix bundle protein [Candidatus Nomurabacteria bacterium]
MIKTTIYDLEERTTVFSKKVLLFCKTLPQDAVTKPLLSQLVRSCTSIGANYMEANGASSKKDFANKVFICKKEAKETMYWLHLLGELFKDKREDIVPLYRESKELTLIFSKISSSSKTKKLIEKED